MLYSIEDLKKDISSGDTYSIASNYSKALIRKAFNQGVFDNDICRYTYPESNWSGVDILFLDDDYVVGYEFFLNSNDEIERTWFKRKLYYCNARFDEGHEMYFNLRDCRYYTNDFLLGGYVKVLSE